MLFVTFSFLGGVAAQSCPSTPDDMSPNTCFKCIAAASLARPPEFPSLDCQFCGVFGVGSIRYGCNTGPNINGGGCGAFTSGGTQAWTSNFDACRCPIENGDTFDSPIVPPYSLQPSLKTDGMRLYGPPASTGPNVGAFFMHWELTGPSTVVTWPYDLDMHIDVFAMVKTPTSVDVLESQGFEGFKCAG
jgi:hypothetical protein